MYSHHGHLDDGQRGAGHTMIRRLFLAIALFACLGLGVDGNRPPSPLADNRIVNPGMQIDQRHEGTSVAIATGNFALISDQWFVTFQGSATGITAQRVADAPAGFAYSEKVTVGVGSAVIAATDELYYTQDLETDNVKDFKLGTASAATVSCSFWVKSNITGTFGFQFTNSALDRSYVAIFTITDANTWQQVKLNGVVLDTTGSWSGSIGLVINIVLMAGSDLRGALGWQAGDIGTTSAQTNLAATSGNTFQLTGVKLAVEPVATVLVPRSYTEELLLCERYYWKTFLEGTVPAQSAGVAGSLQTKNPIALGDPSILVMFPVKMAYAPVITTYNPSAGNANWRNITAAADATVSVDPGSAVSTTSALIATSGTVTTLGNILAIHLTADAGL